MDTSMEVIERYMGAPPAHSVVLTISPALAREILSKFNHENRGLKPHKIRPLIGDLQKGDWLVTGETIKFSDRRLLDGQNRLTACAEAGVAIKTHVVFGIADAAFALIDTGAPRTAGDILLCASIDNHNIVSHAVFQLNTWEQRTGRRSPFRLSPNQILHLYETKYKDLQDHIGWGRQLQQATGHPPGWGVTLHYAFAKAQDHALADQFFRAWIAGDQSIQQASILRRRLGQLRDMYAGNLRTHIFYAMAIKAFNAFVESRPIDVSQLKWEEGEAFPNITSAGRKDGGATEGANAKAKTSIGSVAHPGPRAIRVTG